MYQQGYYWAYRKGSPYPDIVYVHEGLVYEICIETYKRTHGPDGERLVLDSEDLLQQKWVLGDKVEHPSTKEFV